MSNKNRPNKDWINSIPIEELTPKQAFWRAIYNEECRTPEIMDKVTNSKYAFMWAANFGNYNTMFPKITKPFYQRVWIRHYNDKCEAPEEWLLNITLNKI